MNPPAEVPSTFVCREGHESDLPEILRLYRQLNPDDPEISLERARDLWNATPGLVRYFVAATPGGLVGSCNVSILPNLTRGGRPFAVIENVVVDDKFRRAGIGRTIMDRAVEFARSRNCYKVVLTSSRKRTEAHRFYESIGFDGNSKVGFERRLDANQYATPQQPAGNLTRGD